MEGKGPKGRPCLYCDEIMFDDHCSDPGCMYNFLRATCAQKQRYSHDDDEPTKELDLDLDESYDWTQFLNDFSSTDTRGAQSLALQETLSCGDDADPQPRSESAEGERTGRKKSVDDVPSASGSGSFSKPTKMTAKPRSRSTSSPRKADKSFSFQLVKVSSEASISEVKKPPLLIRPKTSCTICEIPVENLSAHTKSDLHAGTTSVILKNRAIVPAGALSAEFMFCRHGCGQALFTARARFNGHKCRPPAGATKEIKLPAERKSYCLMCELRIRPPLDQHWKKGHGDNDIYTKVFIRGIETLLPKRTNFKHAFQFCTEYCQVFNLKNRIPLKCTVHDFK